MKKLHFFFYQLIIISELFSQGSNWKISGNVIQSNDWLGTTNNINLLIKANNKTAIIVDTNGICKFSALALNNPGPNGLVITDSDGKFSRIDLSGSNNQFLSGNGNWSTLPSSINSWILTGNNLLGNFNGNLGLGINNPLYKLDINGSVRISNNLLVGGGIITTKEVNATSTLNSGDVNISGTTNMGGNVFVSMLGNGNTFSEVFASPSGQLKVFSPIPGDPNEQPSTGCNPINPSWRIGGNFMFGTGLNDFSAGTCDNYDFYLKSNNLPRVMMKSNGNIGFGIINPVEKYHFYGGVVRIDDKVLINTNGDISASDAFVISSNLNTQAGANFSVKKDGTVYSREIYVTLNSFPDYVFESDYSLMKIKDLKEFIIKNKRLPQMPSAKKVVAEGANIGELQKITIEKLEESYLYIIELKEELDEVKLKLKKLEQKCN